MKYSLNPKELNNWKARLTERLVQLYIEDVLKPQLEKQDDDYVFMTRPSFLPIGFIERALLMGEKEIDWVEAYKRMVITDRTYNSKTGEEITYRRGEQPNEILIKNWKRNKIIDATIAIPNRIKEDFLEHGIFPDNELYEKNIKLITLLRVATDGLLYKIKKTEKLISKRKAISGLSQKYKELPKKIPLVTGEIEVIEVKSDKSFILPSQARNYRIVIENGFKLRYFHVFILSFIKNQFEIEDRVIDNIEDLKRTVSYFRKVARAQDSM